MIIWLYRIISDLNHANPVFFKDDPFLKHFKGAFSHRGFDLCRICLPSPWNLWATLTHRCTFHTQYTIEVYSCRSSDFSHTFKKASQALSILIGISFSTIRLLAFFKGFWKTSDAVCQERFWEAHSRICTTRVWTLGMTPHLPQVPWNHENFTGCLQPVEQIKMQVANGCPNGESHGSTFHFEQTKGDFDAQFQQFSSWKLVKLVTQQEHPHAINSLTFCLTSLARSHRSHRSHRSRFTRPSLSSATPNNLDVIGDTSQNASFLESQNK